MGKNKHVTRALAPLLCLCMAFCSAPVYANAQEGVAAIGGETFSSWEEALANWDGGETLTLLADVQTGTVAVGESKSLDLSGHTLKGDGTGSVLEIESAAEFSLTDSSREKSGKVTGGNASFGGGIRVSGGTVRLSAAVSGNEASSCGGGIYLANGARLEMEGGTVSDNRALFGGGIYAESGSAVLSGTIEGNNAILNGGGVDVYGENASVLFSDGVMRANTAGAYGGAVSVWHHGVFRMTGGTLENNNARYGGAVNVYGSEEQAGGFELSGGSVSQNTAERGGGVKVGQYGALKLLGGEIKQNTASELGGGVYVEEKGSASLSGSAAVTSNTVGGKANNLVLGGEGLLSLDNFTGTAGIGVAGAVISESFSGSYQGLVSDNADYEIAAEGKTLRLRSILPVSLLVLKQPDKLSYESGEAFNKAGMEVAVVYADGRQEIVSDYTVRGGDKLEADPSSVVLEVERYGKTLSTELFLKVNLPQQPVQPEPVQPVQREELPVLFIALILLAATLVLALVTVCYAVDRSKKNKRRK